VGRGCGLKQQVARTASSVLQVMFAPRIVTLVKLLAADALLCCSGGECKQLRVLGQEGAAGSALV
jgi:hypothetical protein